MPQYRRDRPAKWRAQVRNENGERQDHSFTSKLDCLEYEAMVRRTRERIRAGLERPVTPTLFFDFAATWLRERIGDDHTKGTHPEATTKGEESKMRRVWIPLFANRPIHLITRHDIEKELRDLMKGPKGIGPATRNRHRALLSTLFEAALKAGLVTQNPVSSIPVLEEPKSQNVVMWRSQREVETYIAQARREGLLWYALSMVLAWAGLRINEALALQLRDILWDQEAIVVRRIWEVSTGSLVERTKGKKIYTRPLVPILAEAIRLFLASSSAKRPDDFIFTGRDRECVTYWMAENMHRKILDTVNLELRKQGMAPLPAVTPHAFRHWYVTRLRAAGFREDEVKDVVGHADVRTTKGYMHELPDLRPLVRRALELGFGHVAQEAVQ